MKPAIKYGVIAVAWVLFLVIALSGNTGTEGLQNDTPAPTESSQTSTDAPDSTSESQTPTHAHSYTSEIVVPTCTQGGYTTYTCSCGDTYTAEETAATGHSYSDATCTKAPTCSTCGATNGSASGHTWSDATCTSAKQCTRCGDTSGSALGHSFSKGKCTRCGTADPNYTEQNEDSNIVYVTETGKKYHSRKTCSALSNAKAIYETTLSKAKSSGLEPCSKCH